MKIEDFNFVFLSNSYFGYEFAFHDINVLTNVQVFTKFPPTNKKFIKKIHKIHHSKRINRIINLPFKSLWHRYFFNLKLDKKKDLCFIVNELWTETAELSFLFKKYNNAKFVLHILDSGVMEEELIRFGDQYKKKYNLIVDFDENQAQRFNFKYYPSVHSYFPLDSPIFNLKQYAPQHYDVYFCGRAIDRLEKLLSFYEHLTSKDLMCDFYITDVWPDEQKYSDKIHYNENLSYIEHLNHIINSDCILYIQQQEANAYEWRIINALMYEKKIITNVDKIKQMTFYNSNDISVISEPEEISALFISRIHEPTKYDIDPKDFSPVELFNFIVDNLT